MTTVDLALLKLYYSLHYKLQLISTMKSKNPRAYPEPINTILMYTYYVFKFTCRAWIYPNPLNENDEKAQVVKNWSREEYEFKKQANVDYFDADGPYFFDPRDHYTSLEQIHTEARQCAYYERLHRIRWRRLGDESGFNISKSIGFWNTIFKYYYNDFVDK